jgi:hypothetical protein
MSAMIPISYSELFKAQEEIMRSMIASGMINEIPKREHSMIELSVFKRIKPPAITAKCLACLAGNHP